MQLSNTYPSREQIDNANKKVREINRKIIIKKSPSFECVGLGLISLSAKGDMKINNKVIMGWDEAIKLQEWMDYVFGGGHSNGAAGCGITFD